MNRLLIIFAVVVLPTTYAHDGHDHNFDDGWYFAEHNLVGRDSFGGEVKTENRGHVLHSTSSDKKSTGAAFRCDKGKLFTYIVVKKINIHEMITWRTHRPRRWPVEFSLDGAAMQSEEWVSIHGARVYLVIDQTTALRIFSAAESGTTITVDAKSSKPVVVDLPADIDGSFAGFREACGIQEKLEPV